MATAQQLATRINAAAERADKAKTEIIAAIDDLKAQIVASEVSSPELDAAVSRLEGTVQALDDLNPDGATPAPVQG